MISFRQFLLREAISPHDPDVERNITANVGRIGSQRADRATANFQVGRTRFSCTMVARPIMSSDGPVLRILETLAGGSGSRRLPEGTRPVIHDFNFYNLNDQTFSLRNAFGAAATEVYRHVVVAFRMLLEALENDGLTVTAIEFYGFDPATEPLYERLYRQFLSDRYVRVTDKVVMKKEVFQALLAASPEVAEHQRDALARRERNLQSAKESQRAEREMRRASLPQTPTA